MDWTALRKQLIGQYRATGLPRWLTVSAFPTAVTEFIKLSSDPDATPQELARIIESDIGLTFELLRQVNSSAVSLRHKATTAQRAISVLGIHRSKMILLGAAAQIVAKTTASKDFDHEQFMLSNLQRGLFAQAVADTFGTDGDLAFAGGMISDCILPSLATNNADFYKEQSQQSPSREHPLSYYEQQKFEYCHDYLAAQVCLGWSFPDDLICCIFLHHAPLRKLLQLGLNGSAVVAVRLAACLPDMFNQEPRGLQTLSMLESHFPDLDFGAIATSVDAQTKSMCSSWTAEKSLQALFLPEAVTVNP